MAVPADYTLYRRIFVGRESELKQLRDAFDAADSGDSSLVMLAGEPGIGKTALCEDLASYVTQQGGLALAGHCYEEGSLSLPYIAFVEALRAYLLAHPAEDLRTALAGQAAEIRLMLPELAVHRLRTQSLARGLRVSDVRHEAGRRIGAWALPLATPGDREGRPYRPSGQCRM